jgi:hypothetical protein
MSKETNIEPRRFRTLPHPVDIAARAALAKRPPLSLEQVLAQVKAAEEWRKKNSQKQTA